MKAAQKKLHFSKKRDRRGSFQTIAWGMSYGGGQQVNCGSIECQFAHALGVQCPGILAHSRHNRKIISVLLKNRHVQRIIGYGDSM
jgi:hypothetical protein